MRLTDHLSYETCRERVLTYLRDKKGELVTASSIADHVWPGHPMKRQGAGGAATRVLKRMEAEGVVCWRAIERHGAKFWGWRTR